MIFKGDFTVDCLFWFIREDRYELGSPSIAGANAMLVRTTDTGTGYPSANYALFSGISGTNKTITCNMPLWGGIAGFQIVPQIDPLPPSSISIQHGAGQTVTLSWPANLGALILQESTDLLAWQPTSSQPTNNSIPISAQASPRFFRLARP
jgi:hypothetical protein